MYLSGSGKLQSLRKPFILPDDESESPAWGGAGAQTERKLNPNVSVNSNWVHPPGNPRENFLSERIPATRANFSV